MNDLTGMRHGLHKFGRLDVLTDEGGVSSERYMKEGREINYLDI